jgi:hypothetical protein
MYHVKKEIGKNGEYNGAQNNDEAKLLLAEWDYAKAQVTHQVNTLHATVNGMLNEYQKAATLMGVHTQVAYKEDKPTEYTLFHNPSDNAKLDLIECAYDKTRLLRTMLNILQQ